jgi:hypothetical protein
VLSSEPDAQHHHVAMPKLMGAPAYARPPRPVESAPRQLDPDDLPIEANRTPEEHELAAAIYSAGAAIDIAETSGVGPEAADAADRAREARVRALASRLGLRRS